MTGAELIGKRVKAPLAKYDHVHVLPLPTISMGKGTGVVTSVPSDAPDDHMMLLDLQTKKGLREKLGVEEAWVKGFDPVPIIEIPGMGTLSAKFACEELKVGSHKDAPKLKEAKDKCYLKGFTEGVCLVGAGAGMKVEAAKPIVKQAMVDAGDAFLYYEPEGEVVARTGEQCIVALCDQWLLDYGEEGWKNKVKEHLQSDAFQTYNPKTQHEFDLIIDWLREWGCSRNTGLGTRVPWDKQFVIESLSDSTIYGAFYTIAHLLQGEDNMDGARTGPGGVPADKLSIAAFDYIFLGKPFNKKKCAGLTEAKLKPLRQEFEYWYPMDLRVSAKDLIRNHLTMSLYCHQAVWQDPKKMPRSYFCNGYITVNGEKMSKSTGTFMLLRQCMDEFGTDASRVALADCGDTLDDANFETPVANAAVLKLFTFEQWIQQHVPQGLDYAQHDPAKYSTWDKIVLNELNATLLECAHDYDQMRFKAVVKSAFSELLTLKETYQMAAGDRGTNPCIIFRYLEVILALMNPIAPHFCQYAWQTYVVPALKQCKNLPKAPEVTLIKAGWPELSDNGTDNPVDPTLSALFHYLKHNKHEFQLAYDKAKLGGKKKKKGPAGPEKVFDICHIFVGTQFPAYKKQVLEIMKKCPYDKHDGFAKDYVEATRNAFPDKKEQSEALKYAAFVATEAKHVGKNTALRLEMPFDEVKELKADIPFLFNNQMEKVKMTVHVYKSTDKKVASIEGAQQAAEHAVPGKPACMYAESNPTIVEE